MTIDRGELSHSWVSALARSVFFAVVSVFAMWHVWLDVLTIASRDEEAKHIFLVPLIVGWLVWHRRGCLDLREPTGKWIGVGFIVAGAFAHQYGLSHSVVVLFHLSAILVMIGGLCLGLGTSVLRRLSPALFALLFLIPIPGLIRQQVSLPLQQYSATIAHWCVSSCGISVEQNACVLALDGTTIMIAEACNGMRMLTAVLLVVYAFCFSLRMNNLARYAILLISPVIAMLLNCVRIVITVLLLASAPESFASVFHDTSGWVIPILMLLTIFTFFGSQDIDDDQDETTTRTVPAQNRLWQWLPMSIGFFFLVALFALNAKTCPSRNSVLAHRARVEQALSGMPYAIDEWIAVELPLHEEEIKLLKPHAAFRRTYRNVTNDQEVTVFAIASNHTRDLVGHEPGICYVGQGWKNVRQEPARWNINEQVVHGRDFRFSWPQSPDNQTICVLSVLVTPVGKTTGETSDLAEAASDYRLERFGAAALQVSHNNIMTPQQWNKMSRAFVAAFLPVINQFQLVADNG